MMIIIAPLSAIKLHHILVKTTLQAPISFFETLDSSILINRFSQDMTLVDLLLPSTMFMLMLGKSIHLCI